MLSMHDQTPPHAAFASLSMASDSHALSAQIPDSQTIGHLRVVLADDSPFSRAFLAMLMEDVGFILVGCAADGRQAIRTVADLKPDLVLMDVDMPLLDGIEATRSIKQSAKLSGYAPVIVIVTSENNPRCRAQAEEAGADALVAKSGELRAELKFTLQRLFPGNRQPVSSDPVDASPGHWGAARRLLQPDSRI